MIEQIIKQQLMAYLDVPVVFERPKDAPTSFILIERTGSQKRDCLAKTTFTIRTYADTLYNAFSLATDVVDAVEALNERGDIGGVEFVNLYNNTNNGGFAGYNYQSIWQIAHYEI